MNATILNGGNGNARGRTCLTVREAAEKKLISEGWSVKVFNLEGMSIKPCRGCFACWLKHPGICAIKDDQEDILKALAVADLRVWITPITFGGYSSAFKKALDRSIPVLLPFFIKVGGEVHHPQRYPKQCKLAVFGTISGSDENSERIFKGLVRRNSLNIQASKTETAIINDHAGEAEIIAGVQELIRVLEIDKGEIA
jgi:multimeric flavodoxin WrbA